MVSESPGSSSLRFYFALVRCPSDMRFMQCHAHRIQLPGAGTELTALNAFVQPLENDMCQKLCCRVAAFECGLVVEVPVVQIRESGTQSLACQTDVNDDA